MPSNKFFGVAIFAAALLVLQPVRIEAANFSFTGVFVEDDDVQLFNFVLGAPATVTLRTYSYAGGTNAAGTLIPRGGFDPILALFDATGTRINQNDDGACGDVPHDALTNQCYDTFLSSSLGAGLYTVSVMEYDNFTNTTNLAGGFRRTGQGNFTGAATFSSCPGDVPFQDVSGVNAGCQRDNHWAFDVLGATSAEEIPPGTTAVPEPGTMILIGSGLMAALRRKNRKR